MRLHRRTWRRIFASAGCAVLVGVLWAFWLEPASLTVQEEQITLRWSLHRPLRIAILTDLHVGSPFNGIAKLREIVDRTNAARSDLICILGDLVIQGVIGGRFVVPEEIATELKRLNAPAGVVAVLGNHDGWLSRDRGALERNGIRVLEETAATLEAPAGPSGLPASATCGPAPTISRLHSRR